MLMPVIVGRALGIPPFFAIPLVKYLSINDCSSSFDVILPVTIVRFTYENPVIVSMAGMLSPRRAFDLNCLRRSTLLTMSVCDTIWSNSSSVLFIVSSASSMVNNSSAAPGSLFAISSYLLPCLLP